MYYRGYYIETDGRKFRAYRRKVFLKRYVIILSSLGGSAGPKEFDSVADTKHTIDEIIGKEPKHKWELVEPLDGCPEI